MAVGVTKSIAQRTGCPIARHRPKSSTSRTAEATGSRQTRHKAFPRALQRPLDSHRSRNEDVRLPGLDFLEGPDIQVGQFSQLFLGDGARHPFAPEIGAENGQLFVEKARGGHAPLCRQCPCAVTACNAAIENPASSSALAPQSTRRTAPFSHQSGNRVRGENPPARPRAWPPKREPLPRRWGKEGIDRV